MGNLITNHSKLRKGKLVKPKKGKAVLHKAIVLSPSQVEDKRSKAYQYLDL